MYSAIVNIEFLVLFVEMEGQVNQMMDINSKLNKFITFFCQTLKRKSPFSQVPFGQIDVHLCHKVVGQTDEKANHNNLGLGFVNQEKINCGGHTSPTVQHIFESNATSSAPLAPKFACQVSGSPNIIIILLSEPPK